MPTVLTIILKVLAAFLAAGIFSYLFMRFNGRLFPDSRTTTRWWLGVGFTMVLGAFLAALII